MQKLFSIIIPVFNRPDEMQELLKSLSLQNLQNFEVIVVEDGSILPCEEVVTSFQEVLDINYFYKDNSGPGQSRNFGVHQACTDFFIFFDSDCLIPPHYFETFTSHFETGKIQCYGGPDKAHASFTPIQKAVSYSMTAIITTGGIRGGNENTKRFHPRSFNMGFSRAVFSATQGFDKMRFGEDVDFSMRVEKSGFPCQLINECYVYHKRRADFSKFYRQIYNSGIARINLAIDHKGSLKITHFFPAAFVVGSLAALLFFCAGFLFPLTALLIYCLIIFIDASLKNRNLSIGLLSVASTWVQMYAYGLGFMKAFWYRMILKRNSFSAFEKNFYK